MLSKRKRLNLVVLLLIIGLFSITTAATAQTNPSVNTINPPDGATNVLRNTSITATVTLPPDPGNGVSAENLNGDNVFLYPTLLGEVAKVDTVLNTTGGNDAFTLTPRVYLEPNTEYTYVVTDGLTDIYGNPFVPFTSTFTTGTDDGSGNNPAEFTQTRAHPGNGKYASLAIGPDNRLYATTVFDMSKSGVIRVFDIVTGGFLELAHEITAIPDADPSGNRAVVGIEFDPASTPQNPILWVTNNYRLEYVEEGQPNPPRLSNFTGKIDRLTVTNHGTPLEQWTTTTFIEGLPRSYKDHLANSLELGPDGALYLTMGSQSAMGAKDAAWNNRAETLLSGAVLRIDIAELVRRSELPSNDPEYIALPLDVTTGGGKGEDQVPDNENYGYGDTEIVNGTYYNPLATDATVTIFGTGVRNAYDLVWHSNGNLYVPTNGSAAGGNTPAFPAQRPTACDFRPDGSYSGQTNIPALNGVGSQRDYLYRVVENGYYGHPNPKRCEWVLNGGNSSNSPTNTVVGEYTFGIDPDPNYRGYAYDFDYSKSPNGTIEYQSDIFNNALEGRILVVRYSGGDDIITLTVDSNDPDNVTGETGITGFTGFFNPLDITEYTYNGFLYVSEYEEESNATVGRITLVKPIWNTPPVADQDNYFMQQGDTLTVNTANGVLVNDSDVQLDPLTAVYVGDATPGLTFNTDGSFTYAPDPGFNGLVNFSYQANDGTVNGNTATVTIKVNGAPVANADEYTVNTADTLTVSAVDGVLSNDSDPNEDTLTASVVSDVSDGTLALSGDGSFTYKADEGFEGTDGFTYEANDGYGGTAQGNVTITVTTIPVDEELPGSFVLTGPETGVLVRDLSQALSMEWEASARADSYTLHVIQISENYRVGQVIEQTVDASECTETSCTVEADLSTSGDGIYSWTVVASNTEGDVEASNGNFTLLIQAGPIELLENGGFETPESEGSKIPAGWDLSNATKDKLKCNKTVDGELKIKAYRGECAFMFKGSVGESAKLKQAHDVSDMNIGPADTLTFRGAFKGNRDTVRGVIKVQLLYADTSIPKTKQNVRFELTNGYEVFTPLTFTPESAVRKIKVVIKHKSPSGKVFVDRLSMVLSESAASSTPIDDGVLPLPPPPVEYRGQ